MSDGSSDARYEMERGGWHINSTPKKNPIKKKRKIPWFWRRRTSCPDCGFIFDFDGAGECAIRNEKGELAGFTCSRCKSHYAVDDFYELNYEKYSIRADLSEEESEAHSH